MKNTREMEREAHGNRKPAGRGGLGQVLVPGLLLVAVIGAARTASATVCFNEQAQFGAKTTISVAWADVDGDGDPDLAVGNSFGGNQLFINNGDGTYTTQSQFGGSTTFAVVWADVDNDGDPDMAVGRNGAASQLYINNGNGTFTAMNAYGTHRTIAMAWADANLDGRLDVAEGNGILGTAEQNYLFIGDGHGVFASQAQFGQGQSASVAWGDFNNDGWPDLAVGNGGFGYVGQNYLYVNNGDGTYTQRAEFGTGDTSSLVWGDFNNDGWLDLAVGNWNNGQCYLYRNDGAGNFIEEPVFGVHNCNGLAIGDFNNDGWLDLLVADGTFDAAEQSYLYINNGDGTFTEQPVFSPSSTDSFACADANGDGNLDVAVGNEHSPAQNNLEVNCQDSSPYLEVRPVGHYQDYGIGSSNRDGLGAKIAVYEAGYLGDPAHLLGYREVSAHGGFASQNLRTEHFGLPGRSTVDLRITWPGSSGFHSVQDLTSIAVNQVLTVDEPAPPASVPPTGRSGKTSGELRVSPNPAVQGSAIEWRAPGQTSSEVRIFDGGGRLVRALSGGRAGENGFFQAQWDGRGADGRQLPAGIYLLRPAEAGAETGRILLLR